jgi:hypothetical protein
MRTITENLKIRLIAEAEEAKIQGLTKIAETLPQIKDLPVRENTDSYTYSNDDLQNDVKASIWNIVVRTADFHNCYIDMQKASQIVDFYANDILADLRKVANIEHGIGAYEPNIPGEAKQTVILEIEDE